MFRWNLPEENNEAPNVATDQQLRQPSELNSQQIKLGKTNDTRARHNGRKLKVPNSCLI
jgi:hypothetical protein